MTHTHTTHNNYTVKLHTSVPIINDRPASTGVVLFLSISMLKKICIYHHNMMFVQVHVRARARVCVCVYVCVCVCADSRHKLVHYASETLHSEVRVQHCLPPLLANVSDIPQTRGEMNDPTKHTASLALAL